MKIKLYKTKKNEMYGKHQSQASSTIPTTDKTYENEEEDEEKHDDNSTDQPKKEDKLRAQLKQMYETEIKEINEQWQKVIEDIKHKHAKEMTSYSGHIQTEYSSKLRKEKRNMETC